MINIFNIYDTASMSLVSSGGGYKEYYIPLWIYSNSVASVTGGGVTTGCLTKGSASVTSTVSSIPSQVKLHQLNNNWSITQKFVFEASIYTSTGGGIANASLYDLTSANGLAVVGSQISTSSTTAIVIRSSQFTLTPGHTYAVSIWGSDSSHNSLLTKAYLVAIMS